MKRFFLVTALAVVLALAVYFPAAEILKTYKGELVYFSEYYNTDLRWRNEIPRHYGNASMASAGIFSVIMVFNILVELRRGKNKHH